MTVTQLQDEIKRLEELRDKSTTPRDIEFYNDLIDQKRDALRDLQGQQMSSGQKIGSTVGRIGGIIIGTVMAPVEDCLNGNTNKKTTQRNRSRYMDGGEVVGKSIGGVAEKILNAVKKGKKK